MHPDPYEQASVPGGSGGGQPPGAFRRGRARFRDWRRSRPFWGGLLLILAGLELVQIPLLSLLIHASVKVVIYIGIGGVFGVIFGALLVTCGLLAWFQPGQRVFYAVTGVLLALGSFVVTNLGGFFLGMLLGVIGASLVFGWTSSPVDSGRQRGRRPQAPAGELDPLLGDRPGGPVPGGSRLLALPAAPLLLLGVLATGQAPAAPAQPAAGHSACLIPLLPILCPSPAPAPAQSPAGSASPSPAKSPNPNASKRAAAPAVLTAASTPATLTAGSALMEGLSYDGVANVPAGGGGAQPMLKFSMSSLTLSGGIVLTATAGGHAMVTRNSGVHFTGNVVLYATRLSGDLLGVPLTFTPHNPPPLVLPVMTFTHVVTDQPLTTADAAVASGLDITGR
jgi:hypothetical protein